MAEESLKHKTIKGLAWNTVNTLSNQVISFVIGIILARLLCPSDYGLTAMVGVFTSVLSIFTDGGLSSALIRKENRTESDMSTVFWYNISACWIIYLIIYIGAPFISDFYEMSSLTNIARVGSLNLIISPFGGIQSMLLSTRLDFKTPTIIGIVGSITSGVIAISMAYMGYGVWALVIQGLVSSVIRVFARCIIVRWYPKTGFSIKSFKELFGFSSGMLGSMIIGKIYDNIAPLIIGKYYSPAQLGTYNRALGWAQLPSRTFIITLNGVAFPALSKLQDNVNLLAYNYRRMIRLSAFVSFPMMILLAAVASPLTLFFLTEKWSESIPLLQILCFSLMWLPVLTLNESLLLVTGRSDIYFWTGLANNLINMVIICITLHFGLIAFCYGQIATSVVRLLINTHYTAKLIDVGLFKQMKDVIPIFLNCCFMCVISLLAQTFCENDGVKLFVGLFVGGGYFVVSSWLFHHSEILELIDIIRKRGN